MLLHEEEVDEESVKTSISYLIRHFHPILHKVTFFHVLYFNVLRGQIEIETESKNEYFLMYGYNAGPPMAIPIYTVYYRTV